ncbi:MAG: ribonuclease H-like domain-containing protein [Acidimicrobiales bacterium]
MGPDLRSGALIGLDIETTGLDTGLDRILSIAVFASEADQAVFAGPDEAGLIGSLQAWLSRRPASLVVGWGSGRFDCPMLRRRADTLGAGLELSLILEPAPPQGPEPVPATTDERYAARFGHHEHLDIAPAWRPWAKARGLSCGLKAVARAHGIEVVEVDRTRMLALTREELIAYNLSDARATHRLALLLGDFAPSLAPGRGGQAAGARIAVGNSI